MIPLLLMMAESVNGERTVPSINEKMIQKVKRFRSNNPPVVDELIAALELLPMFDDEREDEWLNRSWAEGILSGEWIYLDFLTCEAY